MTHSGRAGAGLLRRRWQLLTRRRLKIGVAAVILCMSAFACVLLCVYPSEGKRGDTRVLRTVEEAPQQDMQPYTVTMSPVGTVAFRKPPERIVTLDANYNDMLAAVGREKNLLATGFAQNNYDGFYRQLTGLKNGIDFSKTTFLSRGTGNLFDKELLYQLKADVHHIDPLQLASSRGWSKADIEEIARNVAPFFANRFSRENIYHGKEPYEFYTLWQLTEKVAQVYRRPDRVARLKEIGDRMTAQIMAKLPPADKRPKIGLIYYGKGRITPYSLNHGGFGQAQYAAVGAQDAFEGRNIATYGDAGALGTSLDVEGLLSINPDVLIMPFAIYGKTGSQDGARAAFEQFQALKDDPLAKRLKAFQTGRVYPGGTPLQGPLFYLFQIEMAAKQIYPEMFGPFRDDQAYPRQEWLFDRSALEAVLNDGEPNVR